MHLWRFSILAAFLRHRPSPRSVPSEKEIRRRRRREEPSYRSSLLLLFLLQTERASEIQNLIPTLHLTDHIIALSHIVGAREKEGEREKREREDGGGGKRGKNRKHGKRRRRRGGGGGGRHTDLRSLLFQFFLFLLPFFLPLFLSLSQDFCCVLSSLLRLLFFPR